MSEVKDAYFSGYQQAWVEADPEKSHPKREFNQWWENRYYEWAEGRAKSKREIVRCPECGDQYCKGYCRD